MHGADTPAPLRVVRVNGTDVLARRGAEMIARRIADAIKQRGSATLCLSGGGTPVAMFHELAKHPLDWGRTRILQVDERVAPDGSRARNLTSIVRAFGGTGTRIHPMPVWLDAEEAVEEYTACLRAVAGRPPRIDIVQLGLGEDGHTASLFPGDPALESTREVLLVPEHAGWSRMTLTLPVINRSRAILWLVSGGQKLDAQKRLVSGDRSIPASLVERENAVLLTDLPASG